MLESANPCVLTLQDSDLQAMRSVYEIKEYFKIWLTGSLVSKRGEKLRLRWRDEVGEDVSMFGLKNW